VSDEAALSIRRVRAEDAPAVADLSGQLGYPAAADEVRDRILAIADMPAQVVFVACLGDEVVGWVDVAVVLHLQTSRFALIGGLVVKEGLRGKQLGKRLCEQAEAWSREQGVGAVRVTSRSTRSDAHRFYLRNGYTEVKTSRVFEKVL
jgi:GNAT superfamily N-acetyltransferase